MARGVLTEVVSCTPDAVELSCPPTSWCARFVLRAPSQCLTLSGRVRLETESPHITLKHLHVGCSRACLYELLEVG